MKDSPMQSTQIALTSVQIDTATRDLIKVLAGVGGHRKQGTVVTQLVNAEIDRLGLAHLKTS